MLCQSSFSASHLDLKIQHVDWRVKESAQTLLTDRCIMSPSSLAWDAVIVSREKRRRIILSSKERRNVRYRTIMTPKNLLQPTTPRGPCHESGSSTLDRLLLRWSLLDPMTAAFLSVLRLLLRKTELGVARDVIGVIYYHAPQLERNECKFLKI